MNSLNILYLHGWGSEFKPKSDKTIALSKLGKVDGYMIDYSLSHEEVLATAKIEALTLQPDIVIGTSMGGWLASWVSSYYRIPFIALNPAISPKNSLLRLPKTGIDFTGRSYRLSKDIIKKYPDMTKNAVGAIFVEMGDKVLDPYETIRQYENHYDIIQIPGGNHRFTNINKVVDYIDKNYVNMI